MNLAKLATLIFFYFFALSAKAELVGFSYLDTSGTAIEKTTTEIQNPSVNINAMFSAGLERKVKVQLYDLSGALVVSLTSSPVTVSDRFTFKGNDYYGKSLKLSVPGNVDGTYNLSITTLDTADTVISSESQPLIIDTQSPSIGIMVATGSYGMSSGTNEVWKLGRGGSESNYMYMNDVDDVNDISDISYNLYRSNGELHSSKSVNYDSVIKRAVLYYEGIFPSSNLDEAFTLEFVVEDTAGNITKTPKKTVYYDNVITSYTPFGVYDPTSSNVLAPGLDKFVPYVAGMTVKTNPITIAYKVAKSDWLPFTDGGMRFANGLGATAVTHEDDNFVYFKTSAPFGNTNGNYVRFINFGQWGGSGFNYSLVLADTAPKTPSMSKIEYYTDVFGWIYANSKRLVQTKDLPVTVSKVRISSQVRDFPQVASHTGVGSCNIPAGSTACEIDYNYVMALGQTGYMHARYQVYSSGISSPELSSNPTWGEITFNDLHHPVISETYFDDTNKTLKVIITQPASGAYFNRLRLEKTWVDYNGLHLAPVQTQQTGTNYEYLFDLKSLPEGTHELSVFSREAHGNLTSEYLFSFINDKTAPLINISYDDNISFNQITGLEGIVIALTDESNADIISIELTGGPANDVLYMASIKGSGNLYKLEYPRIFPALVENDKYSIHVTAKDEFGNESSSSVLFTYIPSDLIQFGTLNVLPVNKLLLLPDNKPLSTITTEQLRTDEGYIASGVQKIYISLRIDADFPINVMGVLIRPGETKELEVTPTDGELHIPVFPGINDSVGLAPFMVSLPVIESSLKMK
ncbi:MAG: hypothetical protein ACI936_001724 [Paraglaciecola sp.]|jgi:hypothetical protein